jgi:hypothetical protein
MGVLKFSNKGLYVLKRQTRKEEEEDDIEEYEEDNDFDGTRPKKEGLEGVA